MLMAIKIGRVVTYIEQLLPIKSHVTFDRAVMRDHLPNENRYISTTTAPIATQLGRMVINLEWLLPITLLDHFRTWSWEIPDKLKQFYIYYHDDYGHQIWRRCDLPSGGPMHKIT